MTTARRVKYDGTFMVQARAKSLLNHQWSGWVQCATRGSLEAARREMAAMKSEKTTVEQQFRLLHPCGIILEECNNAENVLRK